jgi:hypothetical protein
MVSALRPVGGRRQIIHGDLTGNVLFDDQLPPLVIDPSLYWRPPLFASAVVVADALVFEGAPRELVAVLGAEPEASQYLLRALIFRAVAGRLLGPETSRADGDDRFRDAAAHAVDLAGAAGDRVPLD